MQAGPGLGLAPAEAQRIEQHEQRHPQHHAQQRRPPVRPGQLWLVEHQVHRRADHAVVEQQAADHQRLLRHREEAHLRPEALQDEDHHHQPQRLLAEDAAEREVADHAHREREPQAGAVGLGVAMTSFAAMVQDYVRLKGWSKQHDEGRMIALVGDAELDEGNIYEALMAGWKHGLRNTWWVIDYNRQSLDAVAHEDRYGQFDKLFRSMGWEVVTIKYGHLLGTEIGRAQV